MSTSSYHINKQREELKYVGDYKPIGSAKELARKIRDDLQYPQKCNCRSYNWEVGEVDEVVLKAPSWSERKTIPIDACIVEVVKRLWENDIATEGSCCGHNRVKPNIILAQGADIEIAKTLLDRPIDLLQWRLVNLTDHQCKQCQNTFINEKGLCFAHEHAGKVPKPRHQWKLKRNRDE